MQGGKLDKQMQTQAECGRYVHEYGEIGAPLYAGRVFIECLDSPPVLPGSLRSPCPCHKCDVVQDFQFQP